MSVKGYVLKLKSQVVKGDSESQLKALIKELEEDSRKIRLGIDFKPYERELKKIKDEIQKMLDAQSQVDTKSNKKKQKALDEEAEKVKKLYSEYGKLITEQKNLKKQLMKLSYGGQAYKQVEKELTSVNDRITTVGKSLDEVNKKKFKADMVKEVSVAFESLEKQAVSLWDNIEKSMKDKDFAGPQLTQIKRLKENVGDFIGSLNLEKILREDNSHELISQKLMDLTKYQDTLQKTVSADKFAKKIKEKYADIDKLKDKVLELRTSGYGDSKDLETLLRRLNILSSVKVSPTDSEQAIKDYKDLCAQLTRYETMYKKVEREMTRKSKRDAFNITVSGTLKRITQVKNAYEHTEESINKINDLEKRLGNLNNLEFSKAKEEFNKIKMELNAIVGEAKKLETVSDGTDKLTKLLQKQASLRSQIATTFDPQALKELNKRLDEVNGKIKETAIGIDDAQLKKIAEGFVDRKLISTFDTIQKKAESVGLSIKSALNKDLTKEQREVLEGFRTSLEDFKAKDLATILGMDDGEKVLQEINRQLEIMKYTLKETNIDNKFSSDIDKVANQVQGLLIKMSEIENNGFVSDENKKDLKDVINLLSIFTDETKRANVTAQELADASKHIDLFNQKYKEYTNIAKNEKAKFNFETNYTKVVDELNKIEDIFKKMPKDVQDSVSQINPEFSNIVDLRNNLAQLLTLPTDKAEAELKRYTNTINKMSSVTKTYKESNSEVKKYLDLIKERNSIEKAMSKVSIGSDTYAIYVAQLKKINDELDGMKDKYAQIKSIEAFSSSEIETYAKSIKDTEKKVNDFKKSIESIEKNLTLGQKQQGIFEDLKIFFELFETNFDEAKAKLLQGINDGIRPKELYKDIAEINGNISTIDETFDSLNFSIKIGEEVDESKKRILDLIKNIEKFKQENNYTGELGKLYDERFKTVLDTLYKLYNQKIDIGADDAVKQVNELNNAIDGAEENIKDLRRESANEFRKLGIELAAKDLKRRLGNIEAGVPRSQRGTWTDLSKRIEKVLQLLQKTGEVSYEDLEAELKKINQGYKEVNDTVEKTTKKKEKKESKPRETAGNIVRNTIRSNVKRRKRSKDTFSSDLYDELSMFTLGNILGDAITSGVYSATDAIVELDSAFRDLIKVAPASFKGTTDELTNLKNEAYNVGQSVARSSVDIINSTASALQLGIDNIKDAMQYAKQVNMYANVADLSEADADKYVKSVASAYGGIAESLKPMRQQVKGATKDYSMLTDYMDQANYAGNNYAITSADVGEALMRSASQLKANGNTMSESVGMVIGANETVQDASRVGNALKSLAVNLNGITYSAKEEEIMLNKTAKALKDVAGINVVDMQNGKIKDGFDVLNELSAKWDDLSRVQKAAVAEALGQKYHANTLIAMLDNWDTVLQYQKEYNEGFTVGSMERENARYIDSIEGRIVSLKEQFKNLLTTTFKTDDVKDGLGYLTNFIEVLNKGLIALDEFGLATPTVLGSAISLFNAIRDGAHGDVPKLFGMLKVAELENVDEKLEELVKSFTEADIVTGDCIKSTIKATAKNALLTGGITLLNAAVTALAMYGIGKLIKAWDEHNNSAKNARIEAEKLRDVTKEEITNLNSNLSSVKKMAKRYEELAKKTNRTAEETEELIGYQQELAEKFPELVLDYDTDGNPILNLSNDLDDVIEKLQTAINQKDELLRRENANIGILAGEEVEEQGYRQTDELRRTLYTGSKNGSYEARGTGIDKFIIEQADDFDKAIKVYKTKTEEWEKARELANKNALENSTAYYQAESKQQTAAFDEFTKGDSFKAYAKLGRENKASVKAMIDNFEWSNELVATNISERNKFLKDGFEKIAEYANTHKDEVAKWNEQLELASKSYQMTGDIDQYKESLRAVGVELEKVTGISADKWVIGFTQQFTGESKSEFVKFEGFLKGFNFKLSDFLGGETETIALKKQFDTVQSMLSDLSNIEDKQSRIEFLVDVAQGDTYNNLPPQLKAMVEGFFDDKTKISDQSLTALLTLTTFIEENGALEGEAMQILQKALNGELTNEEIVTIKLDEDSSISPEILRIINDENKEQKKDYKVTLDVKELNETKREKLEEVMKRFDKTGNRERIQFLFETEALNIDKVEFIEEFMDNVRTNPNLTMDLVVEYADTLNKLGDYKEALEWLTNNPEIITKYNIEIVGKNARKEIEQSLNSSLDGKGYTEIKQNIKLALEKGDINELKTQLNSLTGKKKLEVTGDITDVLSKYKTLEHEFIKEQILEVSVKDDSNVEEKLDNIDKKAKEDAVKTTKFEEEGYDDLEEKLITIDENTGLPRFKIVQFTSYGFNQTDKNNKEVEEGAKNETKTVEYESKNQSQVLADEKEIEANAKPESKVVDTSVTDSKTTINTLDTIANKSDDEHKTIWVSIKNATRNALDTINSWFSGGTRKVGGANGGSYNTGSFTDISDSPVQSGVSMASETPTMASSEGDVSASAVSSSTGGYKAFGKIGDLTTLETKISFDFSKILNSLKKGVNHLQELENRITRVTNQIDLVSSKMENSVGAKRLEYLETQNKLYEEQIRLQEKYYDALSNERAAVKSSLKKLGFTFNDQGNLTSYEEKLVSMQEHYEKLEKAAEKASERESNYQGSSKSKQKSYSNATKKAEKARDDYQKKLDEAKLLTDEYLELQFTKLPQAEVEWQDLKNSVEETKLEIEQLQLEDKIYKSNNAITEITSNFDILSNKIDLTNSKLNRRVGEGTLELYRERQSLLEQQLDLVEKNITEQNKLKETYKNTLKELYDVEFKGDSIVNMDEVLNNYQDSYRLEAVTELMETYNEIANDTIPSLNTEMEDLQKTISETVDETERMRLDLMLYDNQTAIKVLQNEFEKLNATISISTIKLESLNDNNKISLYNSHIDALKSQREILEKEMVEYKHQIKEYQEILTSYGAEFDENGNMKNLNKFLYSLKNNPNKEKLTDIIDELLDLQQTLIETNVDWIEFENTIANVNKDKLNVVKDIEDKITEIYKDEIDKRKKMIEEERDKAVESLEKQKEAYKKYREEVEYKDDLDEQVKKISKLQSKIAILERDGSLAARAKIEELREELEEENKALIDMRQENLDKKIEEMYDSQMEKLEKDAEDKLGKLDEIWSEERIADYVKQAIDSGQFESIDGQIVSLKDRMIEFSEESGEALGVMGDVIKNELVGNLSTAMDILKEYPEIFKELGLKQYGDSYKDGLGANTVSNSTVNVDNINITVTSDNPKDVSKEIAKSIETELGYIANNL